MRIGRAKMAEPIQLLFLMVTEVGPRNRLLGGRACTLAPPGKYCRTTVRDGCGGSVSTIGGDAASSRITLAILFGNLRKKNNSYTYMCLDSLQHMMLILHSAYRV